ncbi:putative F-box protein At5g47300 [Bidens hawaiensis]|uniref:putative F-box protein At5g47300 n=1 Tax=Bidens hawaiensis TaxID=980011 RepID=UPI00404AC96F
MKMKKIDELPLSFIECNILPRLPVKTVGRFMRVCKQWKSFLSTPLYARMRLHHVTINDYKLLVLYHRRAVMFSLLDWEPNKDASTSMWSNLNLDPSVVSILVSLDGLICLATKDVPAKLVFWNPFTGAYKRLSETFRKIEYPPVPSGSKDYGRSLVVLNGCVHLCVSYTISNVKQGDLWRMEGDGEWVNMAAFASAEHNELTRDYICLASIDNWLAILEECNSFNKMDTDEFTTHCWDFCSSYTSDKMIYVESVVSPNP